MNHYVATGGDIDDVIFEDVCIHIKEDHMIQTNKKVNKNLSFAHF